MTVKWAAIAIGLLIVGVWIGKRFPEKFGFI